MAGSSKKPFTVPDPLGALQDAADAWQRRYNAAQAAADERRSRARQAEAAAKRAGQVVDAVEAGTATHAALSGNAKALRVAKRVGRYAGPVGKVATATETVAGGIADRSEGMPLDEVLVQRGSGVVLGMAGTALGALGGGVVGTAILPGGGTLAGSVLGGLAGGAIAEDWSDEVGDGYVRAKEGVKRTLLPYTDPLYVMRALRSR